MKDLKWRLNKFGSSFCFITDSKIYFSWDSFPDGDKPEWLTMEQIKDFAQKMGVNIWKENYMINLTVGDLRDRIKDLPDDMDVIIPVSCAEDANYIESFRHARTLGIVSNKYEEKPALCINTAQDGADIDTQLNLNKLSTTCDKVLFW